MLDTVSIMVKMPESLRRQAQAVARLRGETVSEVVRAALRAYVAEALEDSRELRQLDALVARVEAGQETLREHDEVWAELEALEAKGELPD